jgi:hypothetical protein
MTHALCVANFGFIIAIAANQFLQNTRTADSPAAASTAKYRPLPHRFTVEE